jgi:predicted dehydrogenase
MSWLNLGRVRKDENALWSFGPHDVAVALYLFGSEPEVVTAKGEAFLQRGVVDVVFVTMHFPQRKLAHIHLSWLDPHKTRRTTLVGSRKMVVFDDMDPTDKVRIYDKGVDIRPQAVSYEDYLHVRFGDILIPHVGTAEPLRLECQHFVDCIVNGSVPRSDGNHGLQVIRVLAAAQKSLDLDGVPVAVKG